MEVAYLARLANSFEHFTEVPVALCVNIYILFADYKVFGHGHDRVMLWDQGCDSSNCRASFFMAGNNTCADTIATNTIESRPRLKALNWQLEPALLSSSSDHGVVRASTKSVPNDDEMELEKSSPFLAMFTLIRARS